MHHAIRSPASAARNLTPTLRAIPNAQVLPPEVTRSHLEIVSCACHDATSWSMKIVLHVVLRSSRACMISSLCSWFARLAFQDITVTWSCPAGTLADPPHPARLASTSDGATASPNTLSTSVARTLHSPVFHVATQIGRGRPGAPWM